MLRRRKSQLKYVRQKIFIITGQEMRELTLFFHVFWCCDTRNLVKGPVNDKKQQNIVIVLCASGTELPFSVASSGFIPGGLPCIRGHMNYCSNPLLDDAMLDVYQTADLTFREKINTKIKGSITVNGGSKALRAPALSTGWHLFMKFRSLIMPQWLQSTCVHLGTRFEASHINDISIAKQHHCKHWPE